MSDDVFSKSDIAKSIKQPQSGITAGMTPPFKKGIESDMIEEYNTGD